jgi:3'-5' exonuclease
MKKMFLDIETLPAEKEKHHILKELHEQMEEDGKKVEGFEEMLMRTCFDGGFGRIACISYAFNDDSPITLKGDEKQILKDFWNTVTDVDLFIGFNILGFDLRFIYQRSIVLGVKPTVNLSFAKFRSDPIYDIMYEWVKWDYGSHISLHRLAKVLDLPSSKGGEVEGKNVAQAFEDGKIDLICKYCEKDVELTRKIYKRMTFKDIGKDSNEELF